MFSRRKVNSQPVTLALLTTTSSSPFYTQNFNNAFASPAIVSMVDGHKTQKNKLVAMNAAHSSTSQTHVMAHTYSGALIAEAVLPHNSNVVKDAGVISVPYKGAVLICRVQKIQKHKMQSRTKKEENNDDEIENKNSNGDDACTDINAQDFDIMSTSKEIMYVYSGRELLCSLPLVYKYNNEHVNESSKGDVNDNNDFIDDERERAARYPFLCKTNETQRNILDAVFLVQHNAIGIAHLDLNTLSPQSRCNYQRNLQARNLQKANVDVVAFEPYEGVDNNIENNNNNNHDAIHSVDDASVDQLFVSCYCNLDSNKNGTLICVVLSDNTIALCGKVYKVENEAVCESNNNNNENDESSTIGESIATQDDMPKSTMEENVREVDTHGHNTAAAEQEEEEQECKEQESRITTWSSKETWQILARAKLPFSSAKKMNYSLMQPSRVRRVCQVSNNTLCLVQENGSVHLMQLNLIANKNDTTHTTKKNSESQRLSQEMEHLTEEQEEVHSQLHLQKKQTNNNTTSEAFQLEIIALINNIQLPKWSSPEYCFMFMEAGNSCKVRLCYSANIAKKTLLEQREQQQQEWEGQKLHEYNNNNYTKTIEQGDDCIRKTICATIELAQSLLTNNKVKALYSTNNLNCNVHNVLNFEELEEEEEQEKCDGIINKSNFDMNENNAQIATSNKPNYNLTYAMFAVVENVYGFRMVSGLCEMLTQATRAASALYITTLPANKALIDDIGEYKTESLQSDTVQDFVSDNKNNNNVYSGGTRENSVAYYFQQGKLNELHKLIVEKKLHECDLYECCQGCHDELNKIAVMLLSTRMNDANKIGVLQEKLQDVEYLVYALTCRELDSPCASELLLVTENDLSRCTNTLANKLKSLAHSQAQRLLERIHELRYAMQTFVFLSKCYQCCCYYNYESNKIKGDKYENAESSAKIIDKKEEDDMWSAPLATVLSLESAHRDAQTRQDVMCDIIKSDHTFVEAAYLTHTNRNINHENVNATASNVIAQLTLWPKSSALCIDVILTSLQSSTLGIEEKSLCELLLSDEMTLQTSTSISASCSPHTVSNKTAFLLLVLYCSNLPLFHDNHNSDDAQNNDNNDINSSNTDEEEEEQQEEQEHEHSASSTNYHNQEEKKLEQNKVAKLFKLQEMYLRCNHFVNCKQMLSLAFVLCAIDHGVNPFATPFCYNSGVNVERNNNKTNENHNSVMQHYMPECITKISFASIIAQLQIESFSSTSSSSSLLSVWFNNLLCVGAYSNAAQEIASILAFYKEPNTLPLYLAIRMLFVCSKMHNIELVMLLYTKLQHTVLEETAIRALVDVAIHHKSMQTLINLFSSHQRHRTALQIIETEVKNHVNVELRQRLLLEWYIALHRYDDARDLCNSIHPHNERDAEQLHVVDAQLQSLQTNMC